MNKINLKNQYNHIKQNILIYKKYKIKKEKYMNYKCKNM